jgi:hypothetical protein
LIFDTDRKAATSRQYEDSKSHHHISTGKQIGTMVLEVHPLAPSDMPALVTIQMAAFNSGVVTKMFPTDSPTYIPTTIAKHLKSMTEEPDVHYLKVIDTELDGQMIACAKWRINLKERGQKEVEMMLPHPGKEEEGNEAAKAFMEYLRWGRSKYMGAKPFYCS